MPLNDRGISDYRQPERSIEAYNIFVINTNSIVFVYSQSLEVSKIKKNKKNIEKFWSSIYLYKVAVAVQRQSVIHTENSGFASPTLGQHISTFRGYRILFSIINPYINRFTSHVTNV
jgi:hypothetical protein